MPPTFDIEVSRTELNLPALAVTEGLYRLRGTENADNAIQVETVVWETTVATSPWMHGSVAVGRKKGMISMGLDLLVCGASYANISAGLGELIQAVSQWKYVISLLSPDDGVTRYAWDCWTADYVVGFTRPHHWGLAAPIRLAVPRMPVPIAGPY